MQTSFSFSLFVLVFFCTFFWPLEFLFCSTIKRARKICHIWYNRFLVLTAKENVLLWCWFRFFFVWVAHVFGMSFAYWHKFRFSFFSVFFCVVFAWLIASDWPKINSANNILRVSWMKQTHINICSYWHTSLCVCVDALLCFMCACVCECGEISNWPTFMLDTHTHTQADWQMEKECFDLSGGCLYKPNIRYNP